MEPLRDLTSDPMDPLLVVTQLRDLASDPMNRRAIVQDQGCLPGLILFLDHPNPQVVYCALQALRYLAECRWNQEKLRGELGMMLSLQSVIQNSTTPGETRLLASEISSLLASSSSSSSFSSSSSSSSSQPEERLSSRRRAQFFLGSNNKRAKTVTLHIQGLDDWSRRSQCSEALLRTRGVISFTFKMIQRRCIVRIQSELRAEVLASAIASTQVMKALQVVRGENGEEVLVPLEEEGSGSDQDQELPDYLPEDESPSVDPEQALTRGRSERGGSRWLGAASNFLSRSFYW